MNDRNADLLRAIRDELRRLPDSLVDRLRSSSAAGMAPPQRPASPTAPRQQGSQDVQPPERPWYDRKSQPGSQIAAYENLGSALGRFVPALGELAGLSRSFREIMDAFSRLDQTQEATHRPSDEFREHAARVYDELAAPRPPPAPDIYGLEDELVGPRPPTAEDRLSPESELPSAPPLVHYEVNEDWKPPETPKPPTAPPKVTTFELAPDKSPEEPPSAAPVASTSPAPQPPEVYGLAPPEAPRTRLEMPALEVPRTRLEPPPPPVPPTRFEPPAPETRLEMPTPPRPPAPKDEDRGADYPLPPWMRGAGQPPLPPTVPSNGMADALRDVQGEAVTVAESRDVATKLDELVSLTRQLLELRKSSEDSASADETERGENYKARGLWQPSEGVTPASEGKPPELQGPKPPERKGSGFIGSLVKEFVIKSLLSGVK